MGLVVDAMVDARRIVSRAATRMRAFRYLEADIRLQQRQLRAYETGIESVRTCSVLTSTVFAVFVHHSPVDGISPSTLRALRALRNLDINVVFVANHQIKESEVVQIKSLVHSVIVRNNQGFDFGAYKDTVRWLSETNQDLDRLFLMNDSVFCGSQGLDELFASDRRHFDESRDG